MLQEERVGMARTKTKLTHIQVAVLALVAGWAAGPAAAVPPPPQAGETAITLPVDQCRVPLAGTVRGYAQPVFRISIAAPTVIRLLADPPDPALLVDIEHADSPEDLRPVATGVGLAGGDVRIALPSAGHYRIRVPMVGDAARAGRQIAFTLSLARAMESGAPPCRVEVQR
jgi:hypothetical protein